MSTAALSAPPASAQCPVTRAPGHQVASGKKRRAIGGAKLNPCSCCSSVPVSFEGFCGRWDLSDPHLHSCRLCSLCSLRQGLGYRLNDSGWSPSRAAYVRTYPGAGRWPARVGAISGPNSNSHRTRPSARIHWHHTTAGRTNQPTLQRKERPHASRPYVDHHCWLRIWQLRCHRRRYAAPVSAAAHTHALTRPGPSGSLANLAGSLLSAPPRCLATPIGAAYRPGHAVIVVPALRLVLMHAHLAVIVTRPLPTALCSRSPEHP